MPSQDKSKHAKKVKAPYFRGAPVDSRSLGEGAKFFAGLFAMALLYLLLGTLLLWDNAVLRIGINILVVLGTGFMFLNSGLSAGAGAVTAGEILYKRLESGKEASAQEKALPYHPAKGFVTALFGSAPLLVAAIVLALVAEKQATGIGNLPSWVSVYQQRPEVGSALGFYYMTPGFTLEGGLRIVVRLALMPFASMIGSTHYDGLLLLERLSPLLVLIPACFYGMGYLRGVSVRDRIHTDIAASRRKRIRREKKQQQARREKSSMSLN